MAKSLDEIFGGSQQVAQAQPADRKSLDDIFSGTKTISPENPATSRTESALRGAYQGATANLGDEIQGVGAGAVDYVANKIYGNDTTLKESYNRGLDAVRKDEKSAEESHPGYYTGGEIAGAVGTGLAGAATKTGAAISNSIGSGSKIARAAKGAGTGSTAGAITSFNAGEGEEDRLNNAKSGAKVGFVAGGAAPTLIDVASKAGSKVIDKITDRFAEKGAVKNGEIVVADLPKPLQKVAERLRADYPDDAEYKQKLNSLVSKPEQALIEIGGARTKNLAEGSAVYPSGNAKATEFFDNKTGLAPEKIKDTLSKTVSPKVAYYDTLDTVVEAGREKARPLYNEAYKRNQVVDSPIINKILATPEGRSALGEAVKDVRNEMSLVAKPDAELTALAKELEDIGVGENVGSVAKGLKLRTLDYVKRSMDSTINKAFKAGDEAEAKRIIKLKTGLVSELDRADKSGLYAKARKTSGDYLSNRDAMDMGLNFLKEDSEIVSRAYKDFGAAEKQAYKVGVLKSIRTNIENKIDGANVTQIFSRPANRDKLKSILSEKEYNKLLSDVHATDNIYKLRNQITGNSRTAGRQVAAQEFDHEAGQLINDIATKGATRTAIDAVVGKVAKQFDGLSDKLAGQVADVLYESDPKKKYQIVKALVNDANNSTNALRASEAAKQLQVFYSISDKLAEKKGGSIIAGSLSGERQPMKIEIKPTKENMRGTIPADQVPATPASALSPRADTQGELLNKIAQAESGGNPNAKASTSSASGLFQFTNGTWRKMVGKYGSELGIAYKDKSNPDAQRALAGKLLSDNSQYLSDKLGREPKSGELYIAHFLGAPKAARLISLMDKNVIAANIFPEEAKANKNIFYKDGKPLTVAAVYNLLSNKVA